MTWIQKFRNVNCESDFSGDMDEILLVLVDVRGAENKLVVSLGEVAAFQSVVSRLDDRPPENQGDNTCCRAVGKLATSSLLVVSRTSLPDGSLAATCSDPTSSRADSTRTFAAATRAICACTAPISSDDDER